MIRSLISFPGEAEGVQAVPSHLIFHLLFGYPNRNKFFHGGLCSESHMATYVLFDLPSYPN